MNIRAQKVANWDNVPAEPEGTKLTCAVFEFDEASGDRVRAPLRLCVGETVSPNMTSTDQIICKVAIQSAFGVMNRSLQQVLASPGTSQCNVSLDKLLVDGIQAQL